MINHVRTLILNTDGPKSADPTLFFDAAVPPYKALSLPPALARVSDALFYGTADYPGRVYRAYQIMSLLHASAFEACVYDLDLRVTYTFPHVGVRIPEYKTTVVPDTKSIFLIGPPTSETDRRMLYRWSVSVVEPGLVEVVGMGRADALDVTFIDGMSKPIPCLGTRFTFLLQEQAAQPGRSWEISHWVRPPVDLGEVIGRLAPVLPYTDLFGEAPSGVYTTFSDLARSDDFVEKTVGIVLALANRTEELRCRVPS